ncbi:MAG: hypothetical protein VXZ15_07920 [Planctomycetota bacterium]|nr:hypothetical protein [Planctomycetota bacterium]
MDNLAGRIFFASIFLCLVAGCSIFKQPDEETATGGLNMRGYRMPTDSVVVELAIVDAPATQALSEAIWRQLDETTLTPEQRRSLALNGFRMGVSQGPLPLELDELLAAQQANEDVDAETGALVPGIRKNRQRHQLRSGETVQIATASPKERLAWILDEGDYRRGKSFENAECHLSLRSYPRRDGTVRLKLTPEIHHGQPRQGVDVATHSLIFRPFRDKEVFSELEMEANLRPGHIIVVAASGDESLLGHHFLSQSQAVEEGREKLVLVRLVQTQLDDLFDPGQIFTPRETPVE